MERTATKPTRKSITICLDTAAADDFCWFLKADGEPIGWVLDIEGRYLHASSLVAQLLLEMPSADEGTILIDREPTGNNISPGIV